MEEWIPKYILGYLIYLAFIIAIMSNASNVVMNIYDLTPEQEAILTNPGTDMLITLNKLYVISTVSSPFAIVNTITVVLTIIMVLVIAKAIKEVTPVLPS